MKHLFISLVRLYRWILSPVMRFLFGTTGACRFEPTCSCYAIEAFQRHGACRGLRLTVARLLRCHPWGNSGYDPVPPNPNPTLNLNPNRHPRLRSGLRLRVGEKIN
jgi:uncharacterized protein